MEELDKTRKRKQVAAAVAREKRRKEVGMFEIDAPAGTLGITLTTQNVGTNGSSTYVKDVNPVSILNGIVNVGDIILSIDGEDVSHLDANEIKIILARESKQVRVLRFFGVIASGEEEV